MKKCKHIQYSFELESHDDRGEIWKFCDDCEETLGRIKLSQDDLEVIFNQKHQ